MHRTSHWIAVACAVLIAVPSEAAAEDSTIPFVFPSTSAGANAEAFMAYGIGERLVMQGVPAGTLEQNFRNLLNRLRPALESAASETLGDHRIETIELHVLVNAEGSVGIASGGVEGGIRLVFQRND